MRTDYKVRVVVPTPVRFYAYGVRSVNFAVHLDFDNTQSRDDTPGRRI